MTVSLLLLFLTVPPVGLRCVIVEFSDHMVLSVPRYETQCAIDTQIVPKTTKVKTLLKGITTQKSALFREIPINQARFTYNCISTICLTTMKVPYILTKSMRKFMRLCSCPSGCYISALSRLLHNSPFACLSVYHSQALRLKHDLFGQRLSQVKIPIGQFKDSKRWAVWTTWIVYVVRASDQCFKSCEVEQKNISVCLPPCLPVCFFVYMSVCHKHTLPLLKISLVQCNN